MRRSVDPYRSFSRNIYSINSWMKTVSILRVSVGLHLSLHCSCFHWAWFFLAWESLKALCGYSTFSSKGLELHWQLKNPEGIGWSYSKRHKKWVRDPFRRHNNFFFLRLSPLYLKMIFIPEKRGRRSLTKDIQ